MTWAGTVIGGAPAGLFSHLFAQSVGPKSVHELGETPMLNQNGLGSGSDTIGGSSIQRKEIRRMVPETESRFGRIFVLWHWSMERPLVSAAVVAVPNLK